MSKAVKGSKQACAGPAGMPAKSRSRMTNEKLRGVVTSRGLFVNTDGRSAWARRFRDLVSLYVADAGGIAALTELKFSLIRRCAALSCECEKLENALADGQEIDVDLLARLSSHMRRIAESIGLDRAAKDVTPAVTLHDLVAEARAGGEAVGRAKPLDASMVALDLEDLTSAPGSLTETHAALGGNGTGEPREATA
jgi:hypothetical protein